MELETLVNLITNSSLAVIVIAYFMFRDYKFMGEVNTSIQKLVDKLDYFITKEGGK